MYHPLADSGTNENADLEFIEIYNPAGTDKSLWTIDNGNNIGSWRINGEVSYTFPSNTTATANSRMILVPFSPTNSVLKSAFLDRYGLPGGTVLFGSYSGKLSNQGGRVTLEKPLAPDATDDDISWVIVDEMVYSEAEPWMISADGMGYGLHRLLSDAPAADPGSWIDAAPSPGSGIINQPDLMILSIEVGESAIRVHFDPLSNVGYLLQSSTNMMNSPWVPRASLLNQIEYTVPAVPSTEFFRLKRQ